jgi:uncharacterized protein involved in exopolysaccharide biosynthesis
MGSQLIHIAFSASQPKQAATIANTIAQVYREQDTGRSTGPPGDRATRYARQLVDLKATVDKAQRELTGFRQRNGLIDEGANGGVDVALLGILEGRLSDARNARRVADARSSSDAAVSDQVLSSAEVQSLKTQLTAEDLQLSHLDAVYKPEYPAIVELRAQRDTTQRALDRALSGYSANATAGLVMARKLEAGLQRAVSEQQAKVLANRQVRDDAAQFVLALESAQSVYKRSLEGYDRIMFASGGRDSNIVLVSHATPPVLASKPRVLMDLTLGLLAALGAALVAPLMVEMLHRRIRSRDDIERTHGIPVLAEFGCIPSRARE